ncbi:MAG: hypothetical protein U0326_41780 [Polyangiales bacterium]
MKGDTALGCVVGATMMRLGLLPARFPEKFVRALMSRAPLGIISDTSALALGSFGHALAARGANATHAAIPDQVFMELHKQREEHGGKPKGDSVGARARQRAQATASARVVRRLKKTHVLHTARPADPLVRFLGSNVGSSLDDECDGERDEGDGKNIGANAQRDRLILEAVRAHRNQLGKVRLWLLTNDAKLAAHGTLEGFDVALCEDTHRASKELVTSPFIDPWTLNLRHVRLQLFLEELAWIFGGVGVIEPGAREGWQVGVPSEGHDCTHLEGNSKALWARVGKLSGRKVEGHEEPVAPPRPPSPPPPPLGGSGAEGLSGGADEVTPHRRAPSAAALVKIIVGLQLGRPWTLQGKERRRHASYLRALGWIEGADDHEALTPRGAALAERWRALSSADVDAWADWLRDAAADVVKLGSQRAVRRAMDRSGVPSNAEAVAAVMGWSVEDVKTQLRLGNAFGALLVTSQAVWRTPWCDVRAASDALDQEARSRLAGEASLGGLQVGELLRSVQGKVPMGLPLFRQCLSTLITSRRLVAGGATEDRGDEMAALVPGDMELHVAEYLAVDLKRGDWILPGHACQVVSLGGGA